MDEAQYIEVDMPAWIPYANIRNMAQAGVLRFVSIFSGLSASELGLSAGAISCGTDCTIVFSLAGPISFSSNLIFDGKSFLQIS